jgi:hypothetical protein
MLRSRGTETANPDGAALFRGGAPHSRLNRAACRSSILQPSDERTPLLTANVSAGHSNLLLQTFALPAPPGS